MKFNKINIAISFIIKIIIYSIYIIYLIDNTHAITRIPKSWTMGNLSPNGIIQQNSIDKFNKFSLNTERKINQEDVILCLSKAYSILLNGVCSYLINKEIQNQIKQTTPLYCIFNTAGGMLDGQHIPSITEMYLMRYYGINSKDLKKSSTLNNFSKNIDIKQNEMILTNLGINYYNYILEKLKNRKLQKNDFTKSLLNQIDITNELIQSKYPDKYLTIINITQDDVLKCQDTAIKYLQTCTNNKNIQNGINHKLVKESCKTYSEILNQIYKNKAIEVINRKTELIDILNKLNKR